MLKKAAIIEAIFFSTAAVLVLSSILLVGYIGTQGLSLFQSMSPVAFFTGTTWNPNLVKDDGSAEAAPADTADTAATATVEPAAEAAVPAADTAAAQSTPEGQLIQGDQFIEPSAPVEGESAPATGGQLIQGDQFIEPSAAVEGEAAPAAEGQLIQGDQFIEPSAAADEGTGANAAGSAAAPALVATAAPAAAIDAAQPERAAGNGFNDAFGVLPLLLGSLYTAFITLVLSAPLAIMVAVFMVEVAPGPMRRIMRSTVELFAALPSVIFGLLGLIFIVPWVRETFNAPLGKGILAASLVLLFMTQPTIILIAEDALRSLPKGLREAAWGVGATRWQVIWGTVLPAAKGGLFTAIILGMGRAIGETMAVQMVIGNITEHVPVSLVEGASTMPAAIVTQLPEAASPEHRAALIMVAFVLLLVAFLLISLARFTIRKSSPARS